MNPQDIADADFSVNVLEEGTVFHGAIWDVTQQTFSFPDDDETMTRQYLQHPGAVAILAMDDHRQVLLIRQYRHPVGRLCWEVPAGLRDVTGEPPRETAKRELAEEADLTADTWVELVSHHPSSGSSAEHITIYLATDLHELPTKDRFQRTGEEAHMITTWIGLDVLVEKIFAGDITNANTVIGALAAQKYLGT